MEFEERQKCRQKQHTRTINTLYFEIWGPSNLIQQNNAGLSET